jgi:queuine/archaeosine tRNA-ribosyltransferase
MSNDEPPVYPLDDETREYLMDGLNWMLTFADCQINDDAGLKIQAVAEEIAIRFDLPIQKIEITKDEDGAWNVTIDGAREELEEREEENKRPSLSVIEGGKQEDDDGHDD